MNTIVAALFLVLVFTVNGSALDEENSNAASPLMMFGGENGTPFDNNASSKPPSQEREQSEIPPANGAGNPARGTQSAAKDPSIPISSPSDQDPELENALLNLKNALLNLEITIHPTKSSLQINTDNRPIADAERKYTECLKTLNTLEQQKGLTLTAPDSNLSTPPQTYRQPPSLKSNEPTPHYGSMHESTNKKPFTDSTRASLLELAVANRSPSSALSAQRSLVAADRLSTRPARQSESWPHRDPSHLIQLIPNVLGDTPVSAFIVWYWFDIDRKHAVTSWLAANVVVSLAVSPHVTRLIEARSALGGRLMRTFTTPNDAWNPVYFTYYAIAWSIMGRDKTFNVTPVQAMGFMLVSGMIRQLGAAVIKERPCFPWKQGNVWNEENLNKLAEGPRNQVPRIIDRWLPDIAPASLARSASRNIYRWSWGESPSSAIVPGAVQNMILFTGGLVGYYGAYRLVEHVSHPFYRDKARIDQEDLQKLYSNITAVAEHGLALPQESAGEETRLLAINSNAKISQEALKASLDVLNSSYINLFKDPLLFRDEIKQSCLRLFGINRPTPEAFREAYRIIDLLDMYKERVTASTTTPTEVQTASKEFLHTLNGNFHTDVENNDVENHLPSGAIRNFDPLIQLYAPYSKFDPTQSNNKNVVLNSSQESLLKRAMNAFLRPNGYGAIAGHDEDSRFQHLQLSPLSQQQLSAIDIQGDNASSKKTAATKSAESWFSYQHDRDQDSN